MPNFESGVSKYVTGYATVINHFPVDSKGVAYICCEQCDYYKAASRKCSLNNQICEFPARYVGSHCPLELAEGGE